MVAAPDHVIHEVVVNAHDHEEDREERRRPERADGRAAARVRDERGVENSRRAMKEEPSERQPGTREGGQSNAGRAREEGRSLERAPFVALHEPDEIEVLNGVKGWK